MKDIDVTAVIGAFATMIAGFYAVAKLMLNQAAKDREADRIERKAFIRAINGMTTGMKKVATSNDKVALATERTADEAKQRNGHLGEQSKKIAELVSQGNDLVGEVIKNQNAASSTLADETKHVATAVESVKNTLAESNKK